MAQGLDHFHGDESVESRLYPRRLDSEKNEIRLCTIHGGNHSDQICCTLTTGRLDDLKGRYKCLSYVWGKVENERDYQTVYVNGLPMRVTPNLHLALFYIRETESDGLLWIDYLCIDQRDGYHEKEDQVALMGQIYKGAEEVLVWLGQNFVPGSFEYGDDDVFSKDEMKEKDVPAAITLLNYLKDDVHFHQLAYFKRCSTLSCYSTRTAAEQSWREAFDGLLALVHAELFERTWTIQEIVLSQKAALLYNRHRIPWSVLVDALGKWTKHVNTCCSPCLMTLHWADRRDLWQLAGRVKSIMNAKTTLTDGQSLLQPLLRFKANKTSNKLDKIYGLLGLQDGPDSVPFTPDYTFSQRRLFINFAAQLIRSYQWLVPLQLDLRHNLQGLPSWVPDWTYSTMDPPDYALDRWEACWSYRCCGDLAGDIDAVDECLSLEGVRIDKIVQLSTSCRIRRLYKAQLNLVTQWQNFLNLKELGTSQYIGGGTLQDAFTQTLFAARFFENKRCRELRSSDIDGWRSEMGFADFVKDESQSDIRLTDTLASYIAACLRRRLFKTLNGYIGLCPGVCRVGDDAFVLTRSTTPVFLRRASSSTDSKPRYTVLGSGYIHGLMDGEALELGLPRMDVLLE